MNTHNIEATLPEGTVLNSAALRRLESDDLSLRRVLQIIKRQKWLLLTTMVVISGLSFLVLSGLPDIYESEARLIFEEARPGFTSENLAANRVEVSEGYLQNQIAMLSSRERGILAMVDLGLENSAEFNPPDSFLKSFLSSNSDRISRYEVALDGQRASAPAKAYAYLEENLNVDVLDGSQVVAIRFRSESPTVAADVVNQLASAFVADRARQQRDTYEAVSSKFKGDLETLKSDAEEALREVQAFKAKHGLDETVSMSLTQQQISQVGTELLLVRTERVEAEARLRKLEQMLKGGNGVSAIELLNSADIRKLRDDELKQQDKIEELAREYGPLHPVMVSAQSRLKSLRSSLVGEANRVVAGVRDEVGVLRAKERSLNTSLDALTQKVEQAESHSVDLVSLEQKSEAAQRLLDTYLARVNGSGAAPANVLLEPTVAVLSKGYPALEAVAPKRLPLLAVAVVGSAMIGLMLVFARDALQREAAQSELAKEYRSPSAVSAPGHTRYGDNSQQAASGFAFGKTGGGSRNDKASARGIPSVAVPFVTPSGKGLSSQSTQPDVPLGMVLPLGSVPDYTRNLPYSRYAPLLANEDQRSPLMRDVRALFAGILGSTHATTVMLTSPDRTDMKAMLSVGCATEFAKTGGRCVVVDLDIAAASLHKTMGDSNSVGLVDYLQGKVSLGGVIQRRKDVDLVYAGQRERWSEIDCDDAKVLSLIDLLAKDYEKVVLVSAPYLMSTSMRTLAGHIDRTVYVLPEKARQNKKLLSDIVRSTKQRQKEAGVLYLS